MPIVKEVSESSASEYETTGSREKIWPSDEDEKSACGDALEGALITMVNCSPWKKVDPLIEAEVAIWKKKTVRQILEAYVEVSRIGNFTNTNVMGYEEAKVELGVAILGRYHRRYREVYASTTENRNILLYGPEERGMKLLALDFASTHEINFLAVSGSDLYSQEEGMSKNLVSELFLMASELQPCIIFLDNINYICGPFNHKNTSDVKQQLCLEMDNSKHYLLDIFVLAATKNPWNLNSKFKGRLNEHVYVGTPCMGSNQDLIRFRLKYDQFYIPNQKDKELVGSWPNMRACYKMIKAFFQRNVE